jgi:hypothetical protein
VGIFWQKCRFVVTGMIFGKPCSVGLRKERGSNASKPLLVREHLEHRFLVHDFASEGIHETNIVVRVCAGERMGIIIARKELVDDHSLVNEIDSKRAAS